MIPKKLSDKLVGEKLGRPVYDFSGRMLLPGGTVIEAEHIQQFRRLGYRKVFVEESNDPVIENNAEDEINSSNCNTSLRDVFGNVVESLRDVMERVSQGHPVLKEDVEETADTLLPAVMETNNILRNLQVLRNKDEYTLQHSVSVGVIASKMAQLMRLSEEDIRSVCLAGVLHDIGKCRIPNEILNKPESLSPDEFAEIQKHPVYGYKMVREMELRDTRIMVAVLQHHEHQDGKGYPMGIPAHKLHMFSNIIAVADVFDALTSNRPYRDKMNFLDAMEEVFASSVSHLHPEAVKNLRKYIFNISPGEFVLLNNGDLAQIVMINNDEPKRPLVKIENSFINLKEHRYLWVEDFS